MTSWRYLHVDVFTDSPLQGNQLAVFTEANGMSATLMQAIALEMSFPESTFVLPKEDPSTDVKMRIFTPARELPMAGHPTVGAAFALAYEGTIEAGRPRFVLGLGIGPTPVDLEWKGDRLTCAWMNQPRPRFGTAIKNVDELAAGLGLSVSDLRDDQLPVQEVSSGIPFLMVPVRSREAVDSAEVDVGKLRSFTRSAGLGDLGFFVFSLAPAPDGATAYSRMFGHDLGMREDPATGSASGPLGCYLVLHGAVDRAMAGSMTSLQGVRMGRPSRIHISIETEGDEFTQVKVGGSAVVVGEGKLVSGGS
jgi:trans-2,3-dihydro-3-hydroxyanthranilate isomerase